MAEAHPVGFRWVMKAKERGAMIIHVDPRFSRTSAMADLWVPIRSGTDIAFMGGIIHYLLENELYFKEYVTHYTNAANILRPEFKDPAENAGFFSGWDEEKQFYERDTWRYEGEDQVHPPRDETLQHPRCVFQALKRHFAQYTPEMVSKVCGIPPELFHKVADALAKNSGPERTAAFCYAVGWTHQSKGVQIIRTAAILQLLLGNMGRPGGGILALRGHASIQGSTDIPTLYDTLPGYLSMPYAEKSQTTLSGYLDKFTQKTGLWHDTPKYFVSLLKAYYGKNATKENDFGYGWLPKVTGDHSHFQVVTHADDFGLDGYFIMGQNPAVGSQNARLQRQALARTKWLVVRDLVEIESASFWYAAPEIARGEMKTEDIATEVFLMPAASHIEKEGAFTNTQRLLQWREKAVPPPGDCQSESMFIHELAKRLIARAHASGDPMDEPLRNLDWWYPEHEDGEPDGTAILAEINGWHTAPELDTTPGVVHNRDSTTAHFTTVASWTITSSSRTTAARPPAAGFIPVATARTRSTRSTAASRTARTATAGASPGRATAGSSTTAPAPNPTANPGASARNSSGGTRKSRSGRVSTCPISPRRNRPITFLCQTRRVSKASGATRPSCSTTTDSAGSTSPRDSKTARCRRTTSRWNRRCTTRCTPGRLTRASTGSAVPTTVFPARTTRAFPTSSRRTASPSTTLRVR